MKKEQGSYRECGGNVKAARTKAGFTQSELADKVYISHDTLRSIEQNRRNLTSTTAHAIAEICSVRYEYLIGADKFMTDRDLEQFVLFNNESPKLKHFLEDGYKYFIWYVVQALKRDYDDISLYNDKRITVEKDDVCVTVDITEIKMDLFEYAEFKMKKEIDRRLREKSICEFITNARNAGMNIDVLSEEEQ